MSANTLNPFEVLGSSRNTPARRGLVFYHTAAGLMALLTGGIIMPQFTTSRGSDRRLIGVRGIASDAIHLDIGSRGALVKFTKQEIAKASSRI